MGSAYNKSKVVPLNRVPLGVVFVVREACFFLVALKVGLWGLALAAECACFRSAAS